MVALPSVDRAIGITTTLQSAAAATGNGTAIDMQGFDDLTVYVAHASTPTLTVTFEGSIDGGTTYFSVALIDISDNSTTAATDASSGSTRTKVYSVPSGKRLALTHFRARVSAYTGGNVTVSARRKAIAP